jgi:hypothetical protein
MSVPYPEAYWSALAAEHPQVASAGHFTVLHRLRFGQMLGAASFADGVGESKQIVRRRALFYEGRGETHHLPAARSGQSLRVDLAQVVAVWLSHVRQRAENRRRI